MKRLTLCLFVMLAVAVFVAVGSAPAYAVDGVVLINQNTATSGLPGCGLSGFPIVICNPGSYKLSGNLVVPAGVDGIDINADNVTLDLNGFAISGPGVCFTSIFIFSCNGTAIGVQNNAHANFVIRNGTVRGFSDGVFTSSSNQSAFMGGLVEEVSAYNNTNFGISVYGSVVRRNNASFNGGDGIVALNSTVTENVANNNNRFGLAIANGVYGSNTFEGNGMGSVVIDHALSQGNSDCGGGGAC